MSEKDKVFDSKIKQASIFEFKEFYRFLYTWLSDNEYDVTEKVYSEKITPSGKEIEIEWEANRKISDYFKFVIKVTWRILGMVDVEVQKDGKKAKMNKGVVEVKASAWITKDYESRWEANAFLKFMRGVYDRYVIRERIQTYENKLFGEADELIAQAKAFLELEGEH